MSSLMVLYLKFHARKFNIIEHNFLTGMYRVQWAKSHQSQSESISVSAAYSMIL